MNKDFPLLPALIILFLTWCLNCSVWRPFLKAELGMGTTFTPPGSDLKVSFDCTRLHLKFQIFPALPMYIMELLNMEYFIFTYLWRDSLKQDLKCTVNVHCTVYIGSDAAAAFCVKSLWMYEVKSSMARGCALPWGFLQDAGTRDRNRCRSWYCMCVAKMK